VWFYSAVEHSGSLGWLSQIEKNPDCKAIALPLDAFGRVNVDAFPKAYENACQSGAIRPGEAFLASFLWVHNETGIVQDRLTELLQAIQERGGYSLIDAAQSWGKIGPGAGVSLALADWVAASGHKLGAFSGTGVLAFSARARKLLEQCPSFAGTQQFGLRAGTENLVGAWSLGEAAELQAWNQCADLARLRNALEDRILFEIPASVVQGKGVPRAGNTLNVSFHEIPKTSLPLTDLLDLEGFCVSSGSACSSGVRKPSHVLKTLGYSDELALATLRISLTPETSEHELIEKFLPALKRAVAAARKAR
jgi:cysteine desulfurase